MTEENKTGLFGILFALVASSGLVGVIHSKTLVTQFILAFFVVMFIIVAAQLLTKKDNG